MERNETIIRSAEKKRSCTANSEYIFHVSPYSNDEKIGYYEGRFKKTGQNKSLHYHKIMIEIFTGPDGEFYFDISDEEYILRANDTIIIPPNVVHGFRAKATNSRLQFIFTNSMDPGDFFNGFYNKYDQFSVK